MKKSKQVEFNSWNDVYNASKNSPADGSILRFNGAIKSDKPYVFAGDPKIAIEGTNQASQSPYFKIKFSEARLKSRVIW